MSHLSWNIYFGHKFQKIFKYFNKLISECWNNKVGKWKEDKENKIDNWKDSSVWDIIKK